MTSAEAPTRLESIVAYATELMATAGLLDRPLLRFNDAAYSDARARIEGGFELPSTTVSPLMRRFLFHLAAAASPDQLYGAGTYVGFAFAWLSEGRALRPGAFEAVAVDVNPVATAIARRNALHLSPAARPQFRTVDAVADLTARSHLIDLLFIDVYSPDRGKALYADVMEAARRVLAPGALILAHDPSVPLFEADFERYHRVIKQAPELAGPLVLPLDECGISVARVQT